MSTTNPQPASLGGVASFLDRFRAFRDATSGGRAQAFKADFQRLAVGLKPLQVKAAERARLEAPEFNVFSILRVERREVTTHTPFLANLLNPAGTHAQGDLFLRLFWERLTLGAQNGPKVQVPALIAGCRWCVHRERVTESGNFDIHLLCRAMGFQMVIENKIDAGDQEDQLPRYWEQMEEECIHYPNRLLVYLTKQARRPKNYKGTLPPFLNLTYREDIAATLTQAIDGGIAPRLQFTLEQYLDIIARF